MGSKQIEQSNLDYKAFYIPPVVIFFFLLVAIYSGRPNSLSAEENLPEIVPISYAELEEVFERVTGLPPSRHILIVYGRLFDADSFILGEVIWRFDSQVNVDPGRNYRLVIFRNGNPPKEIEYNMEQAQELSRFYYYFGRGSYPSFGGIAFLYFLEKNFPEEIEMPVSLPPVDSLYMLGVQEGTIDIHTSAPGGRHFIAQLEGNNYLYSVYDRTSILDVEGACAGLDLTSYRSLFESKQEFHLVHADEEQGAVNLYRIDKKSLSCHAQELTPPGGIRNVSSFAPLDISEDGTLMIGRWSEFDDEVRGNMRFHDYVINLKTMESVASLEGDSLDSGQADYIFDRCIPSKLKELLEVISQRD